MDQVSQFSFPGPTLLADFLPHGYCMRWEPGLVGTHVVADALIALAYFCISGLLFLFIKKRLDVQFNWIFAAFGLFILACGISHVMDIVTLWVPLYRLAAFCKVVTATVSVGTAVVLYKLMPRIMLLSTPAQMQLVKESEAALARALVSVREGKQQLQTLLAGATNVSIIATDLDGVITAFNTGAENMLQYRAEEVVGKLTLPVFHLESEMIARGVQLTEELGRPISGFAVFVEQLKTADHEEHEWTYIRKDGRHLTVTLVITPLRDSDEAVTGFLGVALDISARKHAEAAAHASEEHFRLIVEALPDYALIMLDAGGNVISWNSGAEHMKGYTAAEIIGRHFSCFYPSEAVERGHPGAELQIAAKEGRYSEEGWRVRKDGSRFLADVNIAAIRETHGELRGFAKVVRDVTEIKRTQQQFQLAVEAAPAAMIMLGTNGLISLVNSQTEKLFSYGRHELLGKPIDVLLPERFRRQHNVHISGFFNNSSKRAMGSGRALFGLRKDGSEVAIEMALNPIEAAGGQFVLASVVDITGRKRDEKQLREQARILDLASDSILIRDNQDLITYWNQGAQKLYGWSKEEALGQVTHALFQTQFPQPLAEIQTQLLVQGYWEGELSHIRRDGSWITVAGNWTLQRDEANGLVSVLEINSDITLRKQAEREAAERTAQLKAVNRELEEFAYVASHDLKAPLRVINNASKWLEDDLQEHLTGEIAENLSLMRGRVKRMDKLLDDLLEYARIGRKTDVRYTENINGAELMDDVLGLVARKDFTIRVSPHFADIQLCRMPLQQILMNLISNAIKHHDKKSGCIDVTVEEAGPQYTFAVKDDGPGISARFHDQVFKMFQTLRPRDQVEGSGMGLAMVRKHVESFGGVIELESAEGQGSTFRFTWPKQQYLGRQAA